MKKNILKAELSLRGMTQGDLAKKMGIAEQTLSNYMNGKTSMGLERAKKIKEVLNFSNEMAAEIFFDN